MRLLLVEDDVLLGRTINAALCAEGYWTDWLEDSEGIHSVLISEIYDLLILDNRLPTKSGIEVLKELRQANIGVPILMLTACDSLNDKVQGLDAGADDYLTKPFEMDELFARIRTLLRRRTTSTNPMLISRDFSMDVAGRKVLYQDQLVEALTAKEFAILEVLLRNKGRFITKHRLLESCTNWDGDITLNTIEVYISRLRKRFGSDFVETFRGVGYRVKE